ncbi:MAG: hypothetical protein AAF502_23470 [Bacteroidota bacterium]
MPLDINVWNNNSGVILKNTCMGSQVMKKGFDNGLHDFIIIGGSNNKKVKYPVIFD